jgi:Flp pilus assembly protein TadG
MATSRFFENECGTTAIEFALVFPALLLGMLGLCATAVGLFTKISLEHGVVQAARCAVVNKTVCSSPAKTAQYAIENSYGFIASSTTFAVETEACGLSVIGKSQFDVLPSYLGADTLEITAQACQPL